MIREPSLASLSRKGLIMGYSWSVWKAEGKGSICRLSLQESPPESCCSGGPQVDLLPVIVYMINLVANNTAAGCMSALFQKKWCDRLKGKGHFVELNPKELIYLFPKMEWNGSMSFNDSACWWGFDPRVLLIEGTKIN